MDQTRLFTQTPRLVLRFNIKFPHKLMVLFVTSSCKTRQNIFQVHGDTLPAQEKHVPTE